MSLETKNVNFGNGNISFRNAIESKPATKTVQGNVTINHENVEGSPAHYICSFSISFELEDGGVKENSYISISIPVINDDSNAGYRKVEDAAAQLLPKVLQSLSNEIEAMNKKVSGKSDGK